MLTTEREITIEPGGNLTLSISYTYAPGYKGSRDGLGMPVEPDVAGSVEIQAVDIQLPGGKLEPMRRQMFDRLSEAGTWEALAEEILTDLNATNQGGRHETAD